MVLTLHVLYVSSNKGPHVLSSSTAYVSVSLIGNVWGVLWLQHYDHKMTVDE